MLLLEAEDEYDVRLLKQQSSSEECSENEFDNEDRSKALEVKKFDNSDDSDDDNGMTMKVWIHFDQINKYLKRILNYHSKLEQSIH